MILKAISEITKKGIPKYFFKEALQLDLNSWQFQTRTSDTFDQAMSTVSSMMKEPLETYPRTLSIRQKWDPKEIKEVLTLLKPSTVHISQMGGKFPPDNMEGAVQKETFYKAEFAIATIPIDVMKSWETLFSGGKHEGVDKMWGKLKYDLPPHNPYIGQHLKPSKVNPNAPKYPNLPHPKLVEEDKFGKLYLAQDQIFGDPYFSVTVEIKTPATLSAKNGAKARVMTELFLLCVSQALTAETNQFSVAGLSFGMAVGKGTNFYMEFGGKNPDSKVYLPLLKDLLAPMKQKLSKTLKKETFEMLRKAKVRDLKNSLKSGPTSTASRALWDQMANTMIPVEKLLVEVEKIDFKTVEEFVPQLLSEVYMNAFMFGQLNSTAAKNIYSQVKTKLQSKFGGSAHVPTVDEVVKAAETSQGKGGALFKKTKALDPKKSFTETVRILPDAGGPWVIKTNGMAKSNATLLMIDGGQLTCDEHIALQVLYKEVGQMFFNELRTKQQTGYVASTSTTEVARRTMVLSMVESSWAGPGDLVRRFEAFNQQVLAGVNNGTVMPEVKMNTIRRSMLSSFVKPIQNIQAMGGTLQGIVKELDGDFDAPKKKLAILKQLTRAKIVAVANKVLGPQNTRKIAVLYSPTGKPFDTMPDAYKPFDAKTVGEFKPKPKYVCNVCVTAQCMKKSTLNTTVFHPSNAKRMKGGGVGPVKTSGPQPKGGAKKHGVSESDVTEEVLSAFMENMDSETELFSLDA